MATLDEFGIAESIRDGTLTSPQRYENITLFNLRITGTGMAFRTAHNEYTWRDPTLYLTDRFLQRCAGLTVTWEHPEKGSLNSDEFADRAIGSIVFAFIVGDAVHGIAKIYDETAADMMMKEQLSTSPGVVLRNVDDKVDFEDGSVLLIEGEPLLLDHLAVCALGVWDKGGLATGVVNSTLRMDSMTEQMKEVEAAAARADAETSAKLDKMMSYFDTFGARLDAMEKADKARRDADEDEKKEKKDAARKDAKMKRDAERDAWMKEDAEACAKDDADEDKDCDKFKKDGDDEDMAADKARSARKDRMKMRKDADEDEKKEKEKEKDDATKMDAARADMQARLDAVIAENERLKTQGQQFTEQLALQPISPNDPNYVSFADVQFGADPSYQAFGKSAPPPMSGESILGYRRRLATGLKKHSKDWKDIELVALPDAALAIAERKIYADAMTASKSNDGIADGIMIPRERVTESGHRVREYLGRTTVFNQFSSPPLYATGSFKTTQNPRGA